MTGIISENGCWSKTMPTALEEYRTKYPEYDEIGDFKLGQTLWHKYQGEQGSDISHHDFADGWCLCNPCIFYQYSGFISMNRAEKA